MERSKLIKGMVAAGALACAPMAYGVSPDDAGWYFGAAGGTADIDDNASIGGTPLLVDDNDTMWKVYGGFQFHPTFAVEAAWVDLGGPSTGTADYERDGVALSVVGFIPLANNFRLHGKLGAFDWDAEVAGLPDQSDTDLMGGIGASYYFSDVFGVRLEWERYDGDLETDALSAGATIHF